MSVYLHVHMDMPMHFVWKFEDKLAGICSHSVVPEDHTQAFRPGYKNLSLLTRINYF